ncbi:MAG: STAS domain-containing protein [Verrucomicrobiae bacterium]
MMTITTTTLHHAAIAAVAGDITHAVADEFQSALLSGLKGSDALVIDCSGVNVLTSAGLRTLLLLHREASTSGKRLALASLPPGVRDVMDVTGFLDQFLTCASVADAVAATSPSNP